MAKWLLAVAAMAPFVILLVWGHLQQDAIDLRSDNVAFFWLVVVSCAFVSGWLFRDEKR